MTMLAAWVLLPVVGAVLALGWGLLVELAAGRSLPGLLLLPMGFAALVVLSQGLTYADATAELTTPVAVLGALAGLVLRARRDPRPRLPDVDPYTSAAAVAVYLLYAAPGLLLLKPTFAGYSVLGDTAIQFIAVDHLMSHGRDVGGLAPSSYQVALQAYLEAGYPLGTQTVLGILRGTVGVDVAWTYQPFLAFTMALTVPVLAYLAGFATSRRAARAAAAGLAAIPALAIAYVMQGSIKEVGTALVVALAVALVAEFAAAERGWRRGIPLAVCTGAAMGVVSLSAVPFLGPALLAALVIAVRPGTFRRAGLEAAVFVAIATVLSAPALARLVTFVDVVGGVVTDTGALGNLFEPLSVLQVFPAWPIGEYRLRPEGAKLLAVYLGVAVSVAGIASTLARPAERWPVVLYLAVGVVGCAAVAVNGSPWADAKAFMIISPAVALAATAGLGSLEGRWQHAGLGAGAVLAALVLWSFGLQYRAVNLAPHDRLAELARIGDRVEGEGPTLYPEYEEYGKHFLRAGAPESPSEPWRSRPVGVDTALGGSAADRASNDVDQLTYDYVKQFRTLVVRRGPAQSRPPSIYERTYRGRYFEVWQRPRRVDPNLLAHIGAQAPNSASAPPRCDILTGAARAGSTLRFSTRPTPATFVAATTVPLPRTWSVDPGAADIVRSRGEGAVRGQVAVPAAGRYDVWLQGSFGAHVEVTIMGRRLGTLTNNLQGRGQSLRVGSVQLPAGNAPVTVRRWASRVKPAERAGNDEIGPLSLVSAAEADGTVSALPASRAAELCGRPVDWVEVWR